MQSRFELCRLVDAVRGDAIGLETGSGFERVCIDSREVRPGDLFWALPGEQTDGHRFVGDALARGAAGCVIARSRLDDVKAQQRGSELPLVTVEDTSGALREFARWHRRTVDALVIGITGSVGKTTTRNVVWQVLSEQYRGVQSPRNYNSETGLPLSLLEITEADEFAVVELAACRRGEIGLLASVSEPEIGVITAVSPVHLATFGSVDEIRQTKAELLERLPASGLAILNGDDDEVRSLAGVAGCRTVLVGERDDCDAVVSDVWVHNGRIEFRLDGESFGIPAAGRHHLTTAALSATLAREVDVPVAAIRRGLAAHRPIAGRCEVKSIGRWTVVDDTYNSSPQALLAACRLLRDWQTDGRKVLVTGDMLELGADAALWHARVGATLSEHRIDAVVAVGPGSGELARAARAAGMPHQWTAECEDVATAGVVLDCWLQPGDVVLVKGSRAMQMERIVETLAALASEDRAVVPRAA